MNDQIKTPEAAESNTNPSLQDLIQAAKEAAERAAECYQAVLIVQGVFGLPKTTLFEIGLDMMEEWADLYDVPEKSEEEPEDKAVVESPKKVETKKQEVPAKKKTSPPLARSDDVLSVTDVANKAKFTSAYIYQAVTANDLQPIKKNGVKQKPYRFIPAEVDRWIKARAVRYHDPLPPTKPIKERYERTVDEDKAERVRLLALARGTDCNEAIKALNALRDFYKVTLPLEEKRLGLIQ